MRFAGCEERPPNKRIQLTVWPGMTLVGRAGVPAATKPGRPGSRQSSPKLMRVPFCGLLEVLPIFTAGAYDR